MAVYCPPSFNEYLTVFNPSNWLCGVNNDGTITSGGISLAYANANFLKFPTAQGSETLVNIDVLGTSQFNGALNEFTNITDFNGITNFNNGIKLNTGTLRFPDATLQTTAYTGAPSVASSVVVANGGSGAMFLALTQGTAGNYPILTNLPQYNATTSTLSAPTFSGNLSTNLITNPSAVALDLLSVNSTPIPALTGNSGMMIGWNESSGDGESDLRNYSQGGASAGFLFSTISLTLPNLDLLRLTRTATTFYQPVNVQSITYPDSTIQTTANPSATISTTVINAVYDGLGLTLTPSGSSSFQNFKYNFSGTSNIIGYITCVGMTVNSQWTLSIYNGGTATLFIPAPVGSVINWPATINSLFNENIYFKISLKSFNNINKQYIEITYPLY